METNMLRLQLSDDSLHVRFVSGICSIATLSSPTVRITGRLFAGFIQNLNLNVPVLSRKKDLSTSIWTPNGYHIICRRRQLRICLVLLLYLKTTNWGQFCYPNVACL